jgi:ABC-type Fe3+/spermidine/putrescine transport system ATPase subunit
MRVLAETEPSPAAGGPVPTRDVVLELREVTKRYGGVTAVDALSLEVRRGEILTLLGPSGCGKTTTLRTIIGLERCDSGEVVYDGQIIDSPRQRKLVPTHKRQMGMVFQSYAIWPHMNVFDNVAYPLRVRGIGGVELARAVERALDQVGLASLAQRPATQLSGGQQQRVALARSLVFEPQLLLLDEPFSNLDAQLRGQMRAELKLLQRRLGVTVVLVTHDQVEALSVSDRIAVMRQGRLEQFGAPEQLYREPASVAVRDFIGRTIVLAGTVDEVRPESVVVRLGAAHTIVSRGPAPPVAPGDQVQVAVRPEHARVETDTVAGPNRLQARIDALLFVGDHYEATLALATGQTVMGHLSADSAWCEGQSVTIAIGADDARVWEVPA